MCQSRIETIEDGQQMGQITAETKIPRNLAANLGGIGLMTSSFTLKNEHPAQQKKKRKGRYEK